MTQQLGLENLRGQDWALLNFHTKIWFWSRIVPKFLHRYLNFRCYFLKLNSYKFKNKQCKL